MGEVLDVHRPDSASGWEEALPEPSRIKNMGSHISADARCRRRPQPRVQNRHGFGAAYNINPANRGDLRPATMCE